MYRDGVPTMYDVKPRFQALLRPMVGRLFVRGVTANQVTLAAVALSALGGLAIAVWPESRWPLVAIAPLLLVRMALNAIDGMLAREFDQKSRLGAVLNELGDVVSDACLYLPLALVPGVPTAPVVLVVLLAALVEMTGVVGIQIGASRRYDGPMGKSDRAFWLALLALLLGLGPGAGAWVGPYLWVLAALSVATVANRAAAALAEAEAAGKG